MEEPKQSYIAGVRASGLIVATPMLSKDEVDFYHQHGYLRIPEVFTPEECDQLSDDLEDLMSRWTAPDKGWVGDWRKKYMDKETEAKSKLVALHDLYLYSSVWSRAVSHPRLIAALSQMLDSAVEFHHQTMHVKPPETGHPFPMHQDYPFYPHSNDRYIDVLVHLDDTRHENGEIRFLDGSHKLGPLPHITRSADGSEATPHLPVDKYSLKDTVAVPAKRGDVVCFNINTIHGSHINTTDKMRRLVRMGYRDPDNRQLSGQAFGRGGIMVHGSRPRHEGDMPFPMGPEMPERLVQ